jgi:DNA-binding NarL/FixJ family response regulator
MKVVVVDKRQIFREALVCVLNGKEGIEVIGTCGTQAEAIDKTRQLRPDIVIIDMEIKGCVEAIRRICELVPETRILVLTHLEEHRDFFDAIGAGAAGYVTKDITLDRLVKAITLIFEGDVIISPPLATRMLAEITSLKGAKETKLAAEKLKLSSREREVLDLIAKGTTNKQIADELFITENTVKAHLRNIMEKLHVHTRLQAALMAKEKGLDKGADTGAKK